MALARLNVMGLYKKLSSQTLIQTLPKHNGPRALFYFKAEASNPGYMEDKLIVVNVVGEQ